MFGRDFVDEKISNEVVHALAVDKRRVSDGISSEYVLEGFEEGVLWVEGPRDVFVDRVEEARWIGVFDSQQKLVVAWVF